MNKFSKRSRMYFRVGLFGLLLSTFLGYFCAVAEYAWLWAVPFWVDAGLTIVMISCIILIARAIERGYDGPEEEENESV